MRESTSRPTLIAIAVVERDGHYLIGQRSEESVLAGFWEFPGGKVEPDERPGDAAVRECLEETGVQVEIVGEFDACLHDYDHGQLDLRFFRCRAKSEQVPQHPFRWVPVSELSEFRFPAANAELLRHLTS
jgi:8-oxo-dGTP diphosphatase